MKHNQYHNGKVTWTAGGPQANYGGSNTRSHGIGCGTWLFVGLIFAAFVYILVNFSTATVIAVIP